MLALIFVISVLSSINLIAMEESSISEFCSFPPEVTEIILDHLTFEQLASFIFVCKTWNNIIFYIIHNKLGPDASYYFLKKYAGKIIKQNRGMRNTLSKDTDKTKQKKLNKKLRKLVRQTDLTFQELKWQIIQLLAQGAGLNTRNKKKEYCIDIALNSKEYPIELAYFLLSLGSKLPKKNTQNKNDILNACFDLSTFDTGNTVERQKLLSLLDDKIVPNFRAHRNKYSLEDIFSIKREIFFTESMRPILNNSATASSFADETIKDIEKKFHFIDADWLAELIQIIQNLGIDPTEIFINNLLNNSESQLLETVYEELNLTEEQLQYILDSIPHEGNGYDFICEKLGKISL